MFERVYKFIRAFFGMNFFSFTAWPNQTWPNQVWPNEGGTAAPVVPVIITVSSNVGSVGQVIIITGTGFGSSQGSSTVTFNGVNATVLFWSDTSIIVTVPFGASTGNLIVTVGGIQSNGAKFTVANHYSVPDCRNYATFPNLFININGTLTYTVPSVDSRAAGAPVDSRTGGTPVACGMYPQNSRAPGVFGPGE